MIQFTEAESIPDEFGDLALVEYRKWLAGREESVQLQEEFANSDRFMELLMASVKRH